MPRKEGEGGKHFLRQKKKEEGERIPEDKIPNRRVNGNKRLKTRLIANSWERDGKETPLGDLTEKKRGKGSRYQDRRR